MKKEPLFLETIVSESISGFYYEMTVEHCCHKLKMLCEKFFVDQIFDLVSNNFIQKIPLYSIQMFSS